jgi:hypothetical protein
MKINYMNFNLLWKPEFKDVLSQYPQHDWTQIKKLFLSPYATPAWYCRVGKNTLPLRNDIMNHPLIDLSMPDYDSNFNKSWAEITDQRCQQLLKNYNNKPWLVLWSGGIDSTMILASILKNFTKEELKQVHVALNRVSVYENPRFYHNHILPNFHQLDSTNLIIDSDLLEKYYLINGEPADKLFTIGNSIQEIMLNNFSDLDRNVFSDPDRLINQLTVDVDKTFASWFYEMIVENIKSVNMPIETYQDFFWWIGFNLNWVSAKLRSTRFLPNQNSQVFRNFLNNFILWFDTPDYQRWAMRLENRRNGVKSGSHIGQYKLPVKQYIFDVDHNEYYFNFKLKTASTALHVSGKPNICMLEDLSILTAEKNQDLILQLLPDHINLN